MSELQPLIDKLQRARFTGTLELHFYLGEIAAAELHHHLSNTEFQDKELPTIEPETEFTLKP